MKLFRTEIERILMSQQLENNEKEYIMRNTELAQTNQTPCEILDIPQLCV